LYIYNPQSAITAHDGLRLERGRASRALERAVVEQVRALVAAPGRQASPEACAEVTRLIAAAGRLGFDSLPRHSTQERDGQAPSRFL